MIKPTKADVGRAVRYCARHPGAVPEDGVLVEINELYAFVRYGRDQHAKATTFGDLDWIGRKGDRTRHPPRRR